jgi:hypothetical protein
LAEISAKQRKLNTEQMKQKELTDLTEVQLTEEIKKRKIVFYTYNVIIGFMTGIAIYLTVKKGLGFFTFFPLFFLPIYFSIWMNHKAVQKEKKNRTVN